MGHSGLRWELGVHRRLVNGSMARALVAKPPLPKLVTLGIDVPLLKLRAAGRKALVCAAIHLTQWPPSCDCRLHLGAAGRNGTPLFKLKLCRLHVVV